VLSDARHNPLGRFDGLAGLYAKNRPGYPRQAIDWIVEYLNAGAKRIVDVGCGTGISARLLAERGCRVIGIEPNDSMRAEAETTPTIGSVDYRTGKAEATGLEDGIADAVVAAQAFHWFDGDAALQEFHRLLRPSGWVTLLWNDSDEADPLTLEFWRILRQYTPEPDVVEKPHHLTGQLLLDHPLFEKGSVRTTSNHQDLDETGFLGRAFSASFAPKECGNSERFAAALRKLFADRARDGMVRLIYRTTAYQARRTD
jgi:SAM-dependent methyltransferase